MVSKKYIFGYNKTMYLYLVHYGILLYNFFGLTCVNTYVSSNIIEVLRVLFEISTMKTSRFISKKLLKM